MLSSNKRTSHVATSGLSASRTVQSRSRVRITICDSQSPAPSHLLEPSAISHIPDERLRLDSQLRESLYILRERYEHRGRAIDSWIEELEELMEEKPKGSRDAVLKALEHGCSTVKQIESYLDGKIKWRRIHEILLFLAEKDLVEIREPADRIGSANNKELHFFLTHSTSFAPLRK